MVNFSFLIFFFLLGNNFQVPSSRIKPRKRSDLQKFLGGEILQKKVSFKEVLPPVFGEKVPQNWRFLGEN